jgi:O-antigen ligase
VLVSDEGTYQAHNVWILALVELGIPGLVLLTWGLGQALFEAWRIPRALRGPPLSALVGLIFALVFLSSIEFKFFWMVLIMIALYANLSRASSGAPQHQRSGVPAPGD